MRCSVHLCSHLPSEEAAVRSSSRRCQNPWGEDVAESRKYCHLSGFVGASVFVCKTDFHDGCREAAMVEFPGFPVEKARIAYVKAYEPVRLPHAYPAFVAADSFHPAVECNGCTSNHLPVRSWSAPVPRNPVVACAILAARIAFSSLPRRSLLRYGRKALSRAF